MDAVLIIRFYNSKNHYILTGMGGDTTKHGLLFFFVITLNALKLANVVS